MILECPSCNAKYDIPDSALNRHGRDVRCAACKHKWHQQALFTGDFEEEAPLDTPDDIDIQKNMDAIREQVEAEEDSGSEAPPEKEAEKPIEDYKIPESVKPDHTKEPLLEEKISKSLKGRLLSYLLAFVTFFFLVFAVMILFSSAILNAWPGSLQIYQMMGAPITVAGEGLVIEELTAENRQDKDGAKVLVLSGRIVNLTEQMIAVPNMSATLGLSDNIKGESWIIPAPVDTIAPQGSFRFKADYQNIPTDIKDVHFTFDLGLGQHKGKDVHISE
jgi:predicted Zn finger-like uncharacterized protein